MMITALVAALCGIDVNVRVQLVWLCDLPMFTPQAVGVPRSEERRIGKEWKTPAARNTEKTKIKIVAMTGDTACSTLRMRLLMFRPSCVTRGYGRRRGRGEVHRMVPRRAAPRDRRERDVRRSCIRCGFLVRVDDDYRTRGRALRDRRERQGPVGLALRLTDVHTPGRRRPEIGRASYRERVENPGGQEH